MGKKKSKKTKTKTKSLSETTAEKSTTSGPSPSETTVEKSPSKNETTTTTTTATTNATKGAAKKKTAKTTTKTMTETKKTTGTKKTDEGKEKDESRKTKKTTEPKKTTETKKTDETKTTSEPKNTTNEPKKTTKKESKATNRKRHQPRLTLEDLDAISDEESVDAGDGGDGDEKAEWSAEARALRRAITEGSFDALARLDKSDPAEDEATEEVVEEEDDDDGDGNEKTDDDDVDGNEKTDGDDVDDEARLRLRGRALVARTNDLAEERRSLPWVETMAVTLDANKEDAPALPFRDDPLAVHDDLKREVAFYNVALAAVGEARDRYKTAEIPFSRPDDFYAEMLKSDEHMARVKDRLIFASKKMAAFERRKANKEQKVRSKEARAERTERKARTTKDNLREVDGWAKRAAADRLGGGRVRDDEDERGAAYLSNQNKKRQGYDKKYGFGGQRGRYRPNDTRAINDMSDYDPRGNFGGVGTKGKGGGGGKNKRQGKRARDAKRQKRS